MCGDRKSFADYQTCDGGLVRMANNMTSRIVGKGTVRYRTSRGKDVKFTDVRHVPRLRKNLISLGRIDSRDYRIAAEGGVTRVLKYDEDVLLGKKTRDLYRLDVSVIRQGARRSHRRRRNRHRVDRRTQSDPQAQTVGSISVQELQTVHDATHASEIGECSVPRRKRVSFAPDVIMIESR